MGVASDQHNIPLPTITAPHPHALTNDIGGIMMLTRIMAHAQAQYLCRVITSFRFVLVPTMKSRYVAIRLQVSRDLLVHSKIF